MIDAPNIIQKILGIDAGLSSGFKTMASVYYASRTAWGAAKGAASVAKKAAGAGTAAMGYTAGTAKGVYDLSLIHIYVTPFFIAANMYPTTLQTMKLP